MEEGSVTLLFAKIYRLFPDLKYNDLVLLSAVKLLEQKEKTLLFSLLLNNIKTERVKHAPHGLCALGAVSVRDGYYVLDGEVRRVLLQQCTGQLKDKFLVQTDKANDPAKGSVYADMLFKTISNASDGNKLVRRLMVNTQMVNREGITHKGFNFLLSGRKAQMWSLILSHLSTEHEHARQELLALCEILSKDPKRVYLLDKSLSRPGILSVFSALDLVHLSGNEVRFMPAFSFLFDETLGKEKILTLESNFRMYIYGSSQLNNFIISLFTNQIREFPNLIISMINEESVRKAFSLGITAKQIMAYLIENALYRIDPNVLEHFSLWEARRQRITKWDAYMLSNFLNLKDYLLVESFCRNGHIEHKSYKEKRMLVVKAENYEEVKAFIKLNIK
ncbi:transcription initiation factor TFIIH subunit 4 [Nematocida sp. AWRm77]|nr:transcription initiation factor TFIIH subunit 4 [Nematocida sp. AWRm77]